ncbi:hypothetical protein K523DRAFT_323376 [Schizophyllum commune Tattone D]|nr:hypothetical protein K523DRAFT_323376 [Schizophyllum commune Tattone D]
MSVSSREDLPVSQRRRSRPLISERAAWLIRIPSPSDWRAERPWASARNVAHSPASYRFFSTR